MATADACVICKNRNDHLVKVTDRGLNSLIEFSLKRNEEAIHECLVRSQMEGSQVFVHEDCRKWFNNKRRLNLEMKKCDGGKKTRRSTALFNWKLNCFLCGDECLIDEKHPSRKKWHQASTLEMRETTLDMSEKRLNSNPNDEWALKVKARINDCIDFVAAETRYHHNCQLRYWMGKPLKEEGEKVPTLKGRRVNDEMKNFLLKTCDWLEDEASIHTLQEFMSKFKEVAQKNDVYDPKHVKTLLNDVYGDHIFFCEEPGKGNLIYFRNMADYIINSKYKERNDSPEDKKERIIKTAANLIKAEIREKKL